MGCTRSTRAILVLWLSLAVIPLSSGEEPPGSDPDSLSSRWTRIDGVDVHYRVCGDPKRADALPLLLLHGWFGSSYDFVSLMKELPVSSSAIAPDLPGHGRSQKTGIVYNHDYYMHFLSDYLHALAIRRVVLVGHSMGGGMAVNFAASHPDVVARLILIDPDGLRGEEGFLGFIRRIGPLIDLGTRLMNRFAIAAVLKLRVFHDRALVTKEYVDSVALNTLTPEARRAQNEITKEVLGRAPVDELLPHLPMPTLVIWGAEDRVLSPKWAREYVARIPDARLAIIPSSGHSPEMEAPEAVARLFIEFAAGASSTGP